VIELVTGLLLGAGIGYGLDWFFDTMPLFLVVFTLLGFAAGVQTMLRSARELAVTADQSTPPQAGDKKKD